MSEQDLSDNNSETRGQIGILISDAEADKIREGALTSSSLPRPVLHLAETVLKAESIITNAACPLGGAFISLQLPNHAGIQIIRSVHEHRPGLPIYILSDGQTSFPPKILAQLGAQSTIFKPTTLSALSALVIKPPIDASPGSQDSADSLSLPADAAHESLDDNDFSPLEVKRICYDTASGYDLYVRIHEGRYVKILRTGDALTRERLERLLKSNVQSLYFKKESQLRYLAVCDQVAATLLKNTTVPQGFKQRAVLTHGEETMSYLLSAGLNKDSYAHAEKFSENLRQLVKDLDLEKQPVFDEFIADMAYYEHGVSTAMIASLLIRPLSFHSSKPLQTVGIAALFHDLGLRQLLPGFQEEDEPTLTHPQRTLFRSHPRETAKILKRLPNIEPSALQAVEQHHERRNKKGFPNRLGAGSINLIAEIVGMSDEFNTLIKRTKKDPSLNPIAIMEEEMFPLFSFQMTEAFRTAFMKKRKR